jgi:trans-aconitate methyltransferase
VNDWQDSFMLQTNPHKTLKIEPFFAEVKKLLSPSWTVLDVGCGRGYGFDLLKAPLYEGIDRSSEEIAGAKDVFPSGKFRTCDLFDCNGKWDVVIACRVLIHIPFAEGLKKLLSLARRKVCIFVALGEDATIKRVEPEGWHYFNTVSIKTVESFGRCRIIPSGSYSTVIYDCE